MAARTYFNYRPVRCSVDRYYNMDSAEITRQRLLCALGAIGSMLAILFYVVLYNRMMAYVENHAYRATPDNEAETKN